jgi:hypothetical protein
MSGEKSRPALVGIKMRIYNKLKLVLFLLFALNLGVQTQTQPDQAGRFSDLSLEITSPERSYMLLQPIPVIFRLGNNTNKNISGHATFRFSCNAVEMFVRDPSGHVQKIEPLSLFRARCITRDSNISPRTQIEYTELLSLDLNRYFVSSGNFALQAVLHSNAGPDIVRSPWLTISIDEPQGTDLAAYEFLKEGTDVSRAFNRHETDEQGTFFEAFSANYPDSPYAPYIQYNLAGHYLFVGDFNKAKVKLDKLKSLKYFVFSTRVDEMLKELATKQKTSPGKP